MNTNCDCNRTNLNNNGKLNKYIYIKMKQPNYELTNDKIRFTKLF